MFYTTLQTIVGILFIIEKDDAIDSILFENDKKNFNIDNCILKETSLLKECKDQLENYFQGKLKKFSFSFNISGTPFQKTVYKNLLEVPYGSLTTYKDIAIKSGSPFAFRAVGMANNRNK